MSRVVALWQVFTVAAALALLEAGVRAGWVSPLFVAAPSAALRTLVHRAAQGPITHAVLLTLSEVAVAFAVAGVLGVALGYGLWRVPPAGSAYEPLLAGLFSSPIILLYPIFLVLFGRTPAAIVAQSVVFGMVPVILYTRQGFAHVRPVLHKVGRSMGLAERQIFWHILLPAAAPTLFTGLRLGLTYILIGAVAMEYIVQIGGIGAWIANSYLRFRIEEVYSGMLAVLGLSALLLAVTYRAEAALRK